MQHVLWVVLGMWGRRGVCLGMGGVLRPAQLGAVTRNGPWPWWWGRLELHEGLCAPPEPQGLKCHADCGLRRQAGGEAGEPCPPFHPWA